MVVASPSVLCDSAHEVASGLPSRIQDRSIGAGFRSTVSLAISIRERDMNTSTEMNMAAKASGPNCGHARDRLLIFSYEDRWNRQHSDGSRCDNMSGSVWHPTGNSARRQGALCATEPSAALMLC